MKNAIEGAVLALTLSTGGAIAATVDQFQISGDAVYSGTASFVTTHGGWMVFNNSWTAPQRFDASLLPELGAVPGLGALAVYTGQFADTVTQLVGRYQDYSFDGDKLTVLYSITSGANRSAFDDYAFLTVTGLDGMTANQLNRNYAINPVQEIPAPIPLPAGAWLMIAGLGSLAALRRRLA